MRRQRAHPLLPETRHDEQSRQDFVRNLRGHLAARVSPGNALVYEHRVRPAFQASHNRDPEHFKEVSEGMVGDG